MASMNDKACIGSSPIQVLLCHAASDTLIDACAFWSLSPNDKGHKGTGAALAFLKENQN